MAREPVVDEEIERNFTYHPPGPGQPETYTRLRGKAKELAYLIAELCPAGRERSLALTQLETAVMWANAAVARARTLPRAAPREPSSPG
jgi:hypothetical protein